MQRPDADRVQRIMCHGRPPGAQSGIHSDYGEPVFYSALAVAGHPRSDNRRDRDSAAMNGRKRCRRAAEAGSAAVEAAFIMSALLLAVVGSMEFARALWIYNTMLVAVEQAGRYAMAYYHRPSAICMAQTQASQCPALSDTPLTNCSAGYAQQVLSAYQAPPIGVSVAIDETTSPPTVTICASRSFDFIAPGLLPYGPLELTSSVTVPII